MSKVQKELDKLGKDLVKELKKNALPNKKTGQLDASFDYTYTYINNDKFSVIISQMFYGKYLNKKTKYYDRAVDTIVKKDIEPIIDVMIDEVLEKFLSKK